MSFKKAPDFYTGHHVKMTRKQREAVFFKTWAYLKYGLWVPREGLKGYGINRFARYLNTWWSLGQGHWVIVKKFAPEDRWKMYGNLYNWLSMNTSNNKIHLTVITVDDFDLDIHYEGEGTLEHASRFAEFIKQARPLSVEMLLNYARENNYQVY